MVEDDDRRVAASNDEKTSYCVYSKASRKSRDASPMLGVVMIGVSTSVLMTVLQDAMNKVIRDRRE